MNDFNENDLSKVATLLNKIIEHTNALSEMNFLAMMGMLIDEYHAAHPKSGSVDMATKLLKVVVSINNTMGEYTRD